MKHHWKCLGKKSEHSRLLLYSGFWIHVCCILFCLPLWPWFSSPRQGFHCLRHRQAPAPKRSVCTFLIYSYAEGYIEKINPGHYQLNSTEHSNQKKKVLSLELSCCFQVRDVILPWTTRIIASFFPLCFASGLNVTLSFDSFVWFLVPASCASNVFFPCSLFSVTCNQGNWCTLKAFW